MSEAAFDINVVLLDCCRDWPKDLQPPKTRTAGAQPAGGGLAEVTSSALASSGATSLIAFATAPNKVALDSSSRLPGHSPFAAAVLDAINGPEGLTLQGLSERITELVKSDTRGAQVG